MSCLHGPGLALLAEAAPSPAFLGNMVQGIVVLMGALATLLAIATYFATRREVEELKVRVKDLEDKMEGKIEKLDRRIIRLLAGQALIAGQMGVVLSRREVDALMKRLDAEEAGE